MNHGARNEVCFTLYSLVLPCPTSLMTATLTSYVLEVFVTIAGNLINARLLEKTTSFSMHDDYTTHCLFQTDYKRPSAAKRSNWTNTLC